MSTERRSVESTPTWSPERSELRWNGWCTRGSNLVPLSARALEMLVEGRPHSIGSA